MRLQENLETMFQLGVAHTLRCSSAFLYDAVCPVFRQDIFIIFYDVLLTSSPSPVLLDAVIHGISGFLSTELLE